MLLSAANRYYLPMRILVIEDDSKAADSLCKGLTESGHTVEQAQDGNRGLDLALTGNYDALVLDRMLPGRDGLSIITTLRGAKIATPALILSALGEVDDRIAGLKAGGDDYLCKPYAFSELLMRLEVLVRRHGVQPEVATQLQLGDLAMDLVKRRVTRAGQVINLQPREFRLLEYLLRHPGQVISRSMLLEQVWDYHFDPQTNVIDVHISRLRSKIDKGFDRPLLHTIRGAGYCLRVPD
jgi:two-component system OmpR family response regulator